MGCCIPPTRGQPVLHCVIWHRKNFPGRLMAGAIGPIITRVSRCSQFKFNYPTMTIKASKKSFNFLRLLGWHSFVHLWIPSTRCVDTISLVNTPT